MTIGGFCRIGVAVVFAIALFTGCSSNTEKAAGKVPEKSSAEDKPASKDFYPLTVGTTWHYSTAKSKGLPPNKEKSQVDRVAKHEKVGNDSRALIECLQDGEVVATEQVAFKDDGLYRFAVGENKFDPPLCLLKLPAKKGDSWTFKLPLGDQSLPVKCTISEEKVKVPAGEYDAVVVEANSENRVGPAMNWKYWYVKGVGKVKIVEGVLGAPFGPLQFVGELEKFEKGK